VSTRSVKVATLLFFSGACALVYQTTWLREFRLVFGCSTAASAAVLAIFIGGLGLGSRVLGARADRHPRPLLLYAGLEAGISVAAALSPLLLWAVRAAYVAVGGTQVLGGFAGGALRLLLSALVLALPTVLMGGTLPAAARFVERREDAGRRLVALLYGVNTVGAVAGAFLSTFVLLEPLGNRRTLLLAALVNLLLAVVARSWARVAGEAVEPVTVGESAAGPSAPPPFVLAAAGSVGFAFFMMELVWYRMLGPLLGGSVFTFGLILSWALLGIGLGGTVYSLLPQDRPASVSTFAVTCLLEAACVGLPFALGDRIAAFALALRPLGNLGFHGHVIAWSSVTAVVVLPTAIVAGAQFPMLIGLLGRGREDVGRHIGRAYAWNTAGAIVGSLAGGFGLLPALSAVGCWRLVAGLLWVLGVAAAVLSMRSLPRSRPSLAHAFAAALLVATPLLVGQRGPTAPWRHGGIGAGRAQKPRLDSPNGFREWLLAERWSLLWEREGVESSVALQVRANGVAFVVNGKTDGHATDDGPTQVMSGLLAAALHPGARTAMVVGLGTGSTAGWLGAVPGIDRVDVAELEAAILDVARFCTPVNHDVLANPRVHVQIGDAREVLLTTPRRYDIILSEPSNPYRAGIASLFTLEFYEAVAARMNPGALFVQWVQPYEVDATTVLAIYRTLGRVFPHVQTWRTHGDMLLVASREPVTIDPPRLRARLASEPIVSAMLDTWRVTDLEGFLARFVSSDALAAALRPDGPGLVNTDDRNHVEFGFARTVGRSSSFDLRDLYLAARLRGLARPRVADAPAVDWVRVDEEAAWLWGGQAAGLGIALPPDAAARIEALGLHRRGDLAGAARTWLGQGRPPRSPDELLAVAESVGRVGGVEGRQALAALSPLRPAEAELVEGGLRAGQGDVSGSVQALERGFVAMRSDPWCEPNLAARALLGAPQLAALGEDHAQRLYRALRQPFAARAMESERVNALMAVGLALHPAEVCMDVLSAFEPNPIWTREFLAYRARCYQAQGNPRARSAARDLAEFVADEPVRLEDGLVEASPAVR
jgi:spermidine synthase